MPRYFFIACFLSCILLSAKAQNEENKPKRKSKFEPNPAVLIVPNYAIQFPYGDMKKRFGYNSLFGGQVLYKSGRNWIVGGEVGFLYGNKVKENYVLDYLRSSTGGFITQYNDLTNVRLNEFGFNVKFNFGKVIPFSEQFPDAGLLLLTGIGFLQHKIGLNIKKAELPQLSPTYRKGYDRLSNGPVISQFVGGTFMGRRKFFSCYAGVQFDLAYTEGRRNYDFYSMAPLKDKRLDMFLGIRIGYIIPIFLQTSEKELFYH